MMGAGLSDLASMYNTTDIPAYLGGFLKGIPSKNTMALYQARSGITYADRVTTPLLILHGANDDRVPIGQPMEFYRALKDRGKTVELVFYPREGHGFREYYHQLDRLQRQTSGSPDTCQGTVRLAKGTKLAFKGKGSRCGARPDAVLFEVRY
jgi:dipeptidyl aminopeptidase/acylaminoacyl peptidase